MNTLVKQTWAAVRVLLVMTVLLGILYPLAVWAVARIPGLAGNAEGSIVTRNGQAVGSSLIGVDPVPADPARDPWFHTRPSAATPDVPSGASNKGPYDENLVKTIEERKDAIAKREGVTPDQVPPDAVTASASGLDPAISAAYADLQAPRVARTTGLPLDRVKQLIAQNTSGAGIGVPGVTVLPLNLAVRAAAGGAH
ncbi:potassium-transporting ATPase subunit C [Amycolatopsis rifamycinica]|uniref:Potassium-transporting ATPase KdpC subunit n=1 Tax=Amycolatopsis rifamycinica TaxID=287986 RepID=A0A066U1B1_9PSEU|nr:potassium-transporting ATPase subunit C [Amycolatopsis rifamycinica]KDN21201.1 potassium ABC transporter ATPase [Amycolatopsis rifamycinica]